MATAKKAKRFRALLEQHDSSSATAITIPFDVEEAFGARTRVPVRGTINGFEFRSSIFLMGGRHFMAVNREMREGAGVKGGETVTVTMERDDEPRTVEPPPELARALEGNRDALAAWNRLSYTHRKEYARAVAEAKKPETRERRVERAVAELAARPRRH